MKLVEKSLKQIAKQLEIRNAYIEHEVARDMRKRGVETEDDIKLKERLADIDKKYENNI